MFPSPTKKTYNTGYAAISPSRPELSTAGKNIVITGGAAGVGSYIASGFAESGAASIALVGRTKTTLETTASALSTAYPKTRILPYVADVADLESITTALASFANDVNGHVNVLVSSAGYYPEMKPLATVDPVDFWATYEANVKGTFNLIRALGPVKAADVTVLHVSTAAAAAPYIPAAGSYATSKMVSAKLWEFFGHENPEATVIGFHPGVHNDTTMGKKAVSQGLVLPGDDGK